MFQLEGKMPKRKASVFQKLKEFQGDRSHLSEGEKR